MDMKGMMICIFDKQEHLLLFFHFYLKKFALQSKIKLIDIFWERSPEFQARYIIFASFFVHLQRGLNTI